MAVPPCFTVQPGRFGLDGGSRSVAGGPLPMEARLHEPRVTLDGSRTG